MNVLFDYQAFSSQRTGGISRYFAELLVRLRRDAQVHPVLGMAYADNEYLLQAGLLTRGWFPPLLPRGARRTTLRLMNKAVSISRMQRQDFSVFHPTYYSTYFLRFLREKPFVLTIYDMIHELFAREMPDSEKPVAEKKRLLALKARKIIAISENTRRDFLSLYPVPPDRVEVIPLANSLSLPASHGRPDGVPPRYLLFVGKRPGYKNFPRLLRALAPLFHRADSPALVCAGGGDFTPEERALIARHSLTDAVTHVDASDELLASLYAHAVAFVFPSLYEGFGMPVLEAFACRCPVAASAASSLPEVAGSAAVYFDPGDDESLLRAVTSLVDDDALRRRMTELGAERLKQFSWESTTEKTRQLYLDCA